MTEMVTIPATLSVERLRISLNLGYGEAERAAKQEIEVSFHLHFTALPEACGNDRAEFICYDTLCTIVRDVAAKPVRLIEFLAAEMHRALRRHLHERVPQPDGVFLTLQLTKCNPPVTDLQGGSHFRITDLPQGCAWQGK